MRPGDARLLGRLAGHREDHGDLLGGDAAPPPGPPSVAEGGSDGASEFARLAEALGVDESVEVGRPASPPGADGVPLAPEARGDGVVALAAERAEDNRRPEGQPLRRHPRGGHLREEVVLTFGDDDACHGDPPVTWATAWRDREISAATEDRFGPALLVESHSATWKWVAGSE